jgi:THO complex subunit 1
LIPPAESFKDLIAEEDFNIDVAKTGEDKQLAINARSSKLWRALRIASKNKFNLLDQIDDGNNLQALFHSGGDPKGENNESDQSGKETNPADIDEASQPFQNGMELPPETTVM